MWAPCQSPLGTPIIWRGRRRNAVNEHSRPHSVRGIGKRRPRGGGCVKLQSDHTLGPLRYIPGVSDTVAQLHSDFKTGHWEDPAWLCSIQEGEGKRVLGLQSAWSERLGSGQSPWDRWRTERHKPALFIQPYDPRKKKKVRTLATSPLPGLLSTQHQQRMPKELQQWVLG